MGRFNQAYFVKIAQDLIGVNGSFSSFRKPCVITTSGQFNRQTQSSAQTVQTVQMVETAQIGKPFDNKAVPAFDIELVGLYSEFSKVPAIENTRFSYGGRSFSLVSVEVDPAQATITIGGNV